MSDVWIDVTGKVYNITPYLEFHPGGVDEIMRGAGKDATQLIDEVLVTLLLSLCVSFSVFPRLCLYVYVFVHLSVALFLLITYSVCAFFLIFLVQFFSFN